jgi:hypothetical protein
MTAIIARLWLPEDGDVHKREQAGAAIELSDATAGLTLEAMKRFACSAVLVLATWACGDRVPTAPTDPPQPPDAPLGFATVSGWVYGRALGDPPLVRALVALTGTDGVEHLTVTDSQGFYKLSARAGTIAIAASKEGYETKAWEFPLLNDTVLNFGLTAK